MLNPKEYCVRCEHRYLFWEESCPECGFDPLNNPEHDEEEERALYVYLNA